MNVSYAAAVQDSTGKMLDKPFIKGTQAVSPGETTQYLLVTSSANAVFTNNGKAYAVVTFDKIGDYSCSLELVTFKCNDPSSLPASESDLRVSETVEKGIQISVSSEGVTGKTIHKVNYNTNGHGSLVSPSTVVEGEPIEHLPELSANGFSFKGWYVDSGCTTPYTSQVSVKDDITLYAGWTNDGSKITSDIVTDKTKLPSDIQKNWKDGSFAIVFNMGSDSPGGSGDFCDFRVYYETTNVVTVTYSAIADNGSGKYISILDKSQEVKSSAVQYLMATCPVGNVFINGGTAYAIANFSTAGTYSCVIELVTFDKVGEGDDVVRSNINVEYSASFSVDLHKVTFNMNGMGTSTGSLVIDGKTVTKPTDPTASGYSFGGWYTDSSCNTAYDFFTPVIRDITLYAKWNSSTPDPEPSHTTHTWDSGTVTKEPTCTEPGEMTYKCTYPGCNQTKIEVIPATGHVWDSGVVTKEATETEEGVMTYTCTKCGMTRTETIPMLEHVHSWDSGVITKEPTCGDYGEKTYTCSKCNQTRTEFVPPTGEHSWDSGTVIKEATET